MVLLAMSLLVFVGVYAIGNPVDILINPEATPQEYEAAVKALGLDKPMWEQYWVFLTNALRGNLGNSFVFNEPALKLILQRMPATLELAFGAMFMAVFFGIPLGMIAGIKHESWIGRSIMSGSIGWD
jgi:peptide/nickel transport system permease protein